MLFGKIFGQKTIKTGRMTEILQGKVLPKNIAMNGSEND